MSLTQSLKKIVEKALEAVHSHRQHDLNLGFRQAIWAEFGPHLKESRSKDKVGHQRRTILAIITARHVLPVWECVWPKNDTPHRILEETEKVLKGTLKFSLKEGRERLQDLWTWLDNMEVSNVQLDAFNVGFSAVKAFAVALEDELFDPKDIDYNRTDIDVDAYDADSSYYAAAAYANGSIWESESDASKRKEFWEWWLQEAVPEAWRAYT